MHIHRGERELLLAVKAVIEARLKDLDEKIVEDEKKCGTPKKSDLEKGLKAIKIKD